MTLGQFMEDETDRKDSDTHLEREPSQGFSMPLFLLLLGGQCLRFFDGLSFKSFFRKMMIFFDI